MDIKIVKKNYIKRNIQVDASRKNRARGLFNLFTNYFLIYLCIFIFLLFMLCPSHVTDNIPTDISCGKKLLANLLY